MVRQKESPADREILTGARLRETPDYPDAARRAGGPVAVIECFQEIPCDPCRDACPRGAIRVDGLTSLPRLDPARCNGCGVCVSVCPGQAIFVMEVDGDRGYITLPWEKLPLPVPGERVTAGGRCGEPVCEAVVLRVLDAPGLNRTRRVTLAVPAASVDEVRSVDAGTKGDCCDARR